MKLIYNITSRGIMSCLGAHIAKQSKLIGVDEHKRRPTRKTLLQAIALDAKALNMGCVQIFTHGPRNMHKNSYDAGEISEFVASAKITLIVHAPFPMNSIWKVLSMKNMSAQKPGDSPELAKLKSKAFYLVKCFMEQLRCAKAAGARYLVVHLPEEAIPPKQFAEALHILGKYIARYQFPVVFENVPVRGGQEYSSHQAINHLCDLISKHIPPQLWGICLDTAHVWSCGIDLSTRGAQTKWFSELSELAAAQIKLFHLNGSKCDTFNKGHDVHYIVASPDDDMYRNFGDSGAAAIMEFAHIGNIPVICEINRGTEREVRASFAKLRGAAAATAASHTK